MVDMPWKASMATTEIPAARVSEKPPVSTTPRSPRAPGATAAAAYEHYLRLPELSRLLSEKNFPQWKHESILRPALQALEITFRLVSVAVSDPRPYANHRERRRRLESAAARQIEIVAAFCEDPDDSAGAPIAQASSSSHGVLARGGSSQEVWKLPGTSAVVSRTSEASLLPRLAAWERSEDVAAKILFQIEGQMHRSPFTLGLGEPNLSGKPTLDYDLVVRPSVLHSLKRSPIEWNNHESQTLFTIHQILESWLFTARELLKRIGDRVDGEEWDKAASDCWILEKIWKLVSEVEDLHLLMDPDDFLRLKGQLAIRAADGSEAFCFRSSALLDVTSGSRDLKRKVPRILGVEVDPNGGPRVMDAAMRLFYSRRRGEDDGGSAARIHVLQAFQAVEAAVKRFFFGYRQLITAVMGSLEATGNHGLGFSVEPSDSLSTMFLEPPYFPSLDAAKTFLGELYWQNEHRSRDDGSTCRTRR